MIKFGSFILPNRNQKSFIKGKKILLKMRLGNDEKEKFPSEITSLRPSIISLVSRQDRQKSLKKRKVKQRVRL